LEAVSIRNGFSATWRVSFHIDLSFSDPRLNNFALTNYDDTISCWASWL